MQITLAELFAKINAAKARMSPKNSHRVLFDQCQEVLFQMAQALSTASTPAAVELAEPSRSQDADGSIAQV